MKKVITTVQYASQERKRIKVSRVQNVQYFIQYFIQYFYSTEVEQRIKAAQQPSPLNERNYSFTYHIHYPTNLIIKP